MNRTYSVAHPKPFSWLEVFIIAFGIVGVVVFFTFYESAFPDASVNVSITRQQAEAIASDTLRELGYSADNYKFAISFSSDQSASYYLQRTLGIEEANARLAQENWPLFYWSARWFKPLQKEEFRVYLTPDGKFLGLNHVVEENAAGAAIPQEQAKAIAETFLVNHAGWDSAAWETIEASSIALPGGRMDHTFSWKSRQYSAGESELRYSVVVQGDQVGYMDTFIKVPESFNRQYATERNNAGIINTFAYVLGIFGFIVAGMIAIAKVRPDARRGFFPALLAGTVSLAAQLNYLPLYPFSYDTTENYAAFWLMNAFGILLSALFSFVMIYLACMGGQALTKFVWPGRDRVWDRGPMQWVTFSRSALRGLFLGGAQMGYVVLFYIVTTRFLGWWSPVTAGYTNLFGTPFPFLSAYDVGLSAALTEEFLFRLIGISTFLWIFQKKHTWLAVLIPSLIWAFAHSSYVAYPIYARIVELTIVAIILSLIFFKFDLLTTIMSHFTYNMMVTGIVLLRSDEAYYQTSGWIVIATLALPLLPGLLWALWRILRKEPLPPETLNLAPAIEADLPQLTALPVKADWSSLLKQPNRNTFCLKAGEGLVGFVTGYVDNNRGWVDGVYIVKAWQRQYWGSILLNAIREYYQDEGVEQIQAVLPTKAAQAVSFLKTQFWHEHAMVVAPVEPPTLGAVVKKMLNALHKKKETSSIEWEIPRDVL
ncbi:Sporulation-killing factor biosynthesis protein SkfC [Anaerolineales bacterium]|nr:Sporulation-killing factor biosynthesis protein SkfC [Anaerolineales bacterium]